MSTSGSIFVSANVLSPCLGQKHGTFRQRGPPPNDPFGRLRLRQSVRGASVWGSASGSGTEGRSGVYSSAETGVQRGAAEPQTEARRNGRCEIPVRDERERNAAHRPPPEG